MNKIMPLDVLSSIKGAKPSNAVEELFLKVKTAINEVDTKTISENQVRILDFNMLREDTVINSDEEEVRLIKQNFPLQKDGYLVVPRVIEE